MTRTKTYYENRVSLLTGRGRDNSRIVRKLMRRLRKIDE